MYKMHKVTRMVKRRPMYTTLYMFMQYTALYSVLLVVSIMHRNKIITYNIHALCIVHDYMYTYM